MDAVYLVGPAPTDELRYSLRTVANLVQVDRVVIAGHRPDWVTGVLHIPVDAPWRGKHHSTWANLRAAVGCPEVSSEFVLMNDDFFVIRPVERVPVWHRGPIAGQIANHERTGNQKLRNRRMTLAEMLDVMGVPGRLDYELHVPMPVRKAEMADVMARAERIRTTRMEPVGKRTLYGNVADVGGSLAEDVKFRDFRAVPGADATFTSTSDYSFRAGYVGRWIRARFEAPSPYERGRHG